ncbi:hypothetical protein QLL95_gp0196 [Cotonvirus japonicus]|uniref:MotA/TolQ/ExbB proton channel domain-containing protein n=1 Tax=Cotonvirus japonicus TaxID=2811091 RepID=A0ABM7NR97_9VIRU|nr:hypothetical protein QLL95_gp0196 [Cotonvirus japonicus]BCS82685.1 hypothetical protein [Cotonvirus japonicus]
MLPPHIERYYEYKYYSKMGEIIIPLIGMVGGIVGFFGSHYFIESVNFFRKDKISTEIHFTSVIASTIIGGVMAYPITGALALIIFYKSKK